MREQRTRPSGSGLLAGYLPLAIVGVLIVTMVWLVPSEVPVTAVAEGGSGIVAGDVGTTASGWGEGVEPCDEGGPQDDILEYSPPCFTFTGDNNGETHTGVTGDTIRVSWRDLPATGHFIQTLSELAGNDLGESSGDLVRTAEGLIDYFNENFEFYGREIELVDFEGQGSQLDELFGAGQEEAGVDARRAAEQNVFAEAYAVSQPYAEELASEGIVSLGVPYMSRTWFREQGGLAWSPFVDCTTVAEVSAGALTGRFLDEPVAVGEFEGQPRQMGAVYPNNDQYRQCGDIFQGLIEVAGYDIPEPRMYPLDFNQAGQNAGGILDNLMRDGVTTVGYAGDPVLLNSLVAEAEQRGYEPEWVVASVGYVDIDLVGQLIAAGSGDQWRRAFGVSVTGSALGFDEMDAYEAYTSVRDDEPSLILEFLYSLLLPLAVGVQMAGPELTPETFAEGLYRYPPTEGWLGTIDYSPELPSGRADIRFLYWDADGTSPFNERQGTWADTGERFSDIDDLPSAEELLEGVEAGQ